ncbi:hypothetical protein ID866_7788 [Astraeus odoratus]|nr:hypothetical protein ID866_7788 [Astraeus odoratus]
MALPPIMRPMLVAGRFEAPHTLDIFLDYVCPYSAKMSLAIDTVLKPLLQEGGNYEGKVKIIIRHQVQPWHGTSTFTHEAGLAVARVAPAQYWQFSRELFEKQGDFFDIPASTLTPLQIREKLAEIAASVIPADKVDEFKDMLKHQSTKNGGVAVTDDLKYTGKSCGLCVCSTFVANPVTTLVKFSRQNGIHVSPTVMWDGLIANEISSSWGLKEWSEFLAQKVTE